MLCSSASRVHRKEEGKAKVKIFLLGLLVGLGILPPLGAGLGGGEVGRYRLFQPIIRGGDTLVLIVGTPTGAEKLSAPCKARRKPPPKRGLFNFSDGYRLDHGLIIPDTSPPRSSRES
jgi:hypothetical protein